jgi:hypothetical protein
MPLTKFEGNSGGSSLGDVFFKLISYDVIKAQESLSCCWLECLMACMIQRSNVLLKVVEIFFSITVLSLLSGDWYLFLELLLHASSYIHLSLPRIGMARLHV